ncbi:MAG: helix-turn-helix transcriptional regulator [Candidatus Micrarchaeaceae archaeon]
MPSTSIGKTMIPVQLRKNNSRQPVAPQRFITKKSPQGQKLADGSVSEGADVLNDVSFLRLPEVKAITGLSKTSIYELIREKRFPPPVRLGPRAVAWVKSEVRQWAVERVQASRSAA